VNAPRCTGCQQRARGLTPGAMACGLCPGCWKVIPEPLRHRVRQAVAAARKAYVTGAMRPAAADRLARAVAEAHAAAVKLGRPRQLDMFV